MAETLDMQDALVMQLNRVIIDGKIENIRRLPSYRNLVYLAKTDQGSEFVFKLSHVTSSEHIQREYRAVCDLYPKGAPVPRPLQIIREDDFQVNLGGGGYIIRGYEFVKGNTPIPSETTFFSLGCSLGRLHSIWGEVERPPWIPKETIGNLLCASIEDLKKHYDDPDKLQVVEQLTCLVTSVVEAHTDPDFLGFSHGDAHHLNTILTSSGEITFLDFEDVCWQFRAYDLATAIWGTFGRGGSTSIWNGLIAGYSSVQKLSQEEAFLIRFLIFVRHLWWLGFNARNWNQWPQRYSSNQFFESGIELLIDIAEDVCGLTV